VPAMQGCNQQKHLDHHQWLVYLGPVLETATMYVFRRAIKVAVALA